MTLGVVAGFLLREQAELFKPFGALFTNMVKMLVMPLIFTSVVLAVAGMENDKAVGTMGGWFIFWMVVLSLLAALTGMGAAELIRPGEGVGLASALAGMEAPKPVEPLTFSRLIAELAPANVITAMAENNILQVIVFAVLLGIAMRHAGEKSRRFAELVESVSHVIHALTHLVIALSPLGVFALMAWMVGTQEVGILVSLGKMIATLYLAMVFFYLVVYGGLLWLMGMNPLRFFARTLEVVLFAASTTSSAATLPLTMQVSEEKLGVSKATSQFVLPIGVSINMQGTAASVCICALFVAQGMGVTLGLQDYAMLAMVALFATLGTAGVPSAGIIMISLALSTLHLPVVAIGMFLGVYRLLDMANTTMNVLGDVVIAMVIDKSEGRWVRVG